MSQLENLEVQATTPADNIFYQFSLAFYAGQQFGCQFVDSESNDAAANDQIEAQHESGIERRPGNNESRMQQHEHKNEHAQI